LARLINKPNATPTEALTPSSIIICNAVTIDRSLLRLPRVGSDLLDEEDAIFTLLPMLNTIIGSS
jgi:hypothetical protein